MAGKVPDRILRGKKKGFNVPIPSWLRHDLRQIVHDTLAPRRLQESGLWDAPFVGRMIQEHEARQRDWSRNIWCLLIFQLWHDTHVKGWSQRCQMAAAHDSSGI
jgi:asparagine synthase (glutamine-hydrolysing)